MSATGHLYGLMGEVFEEVVSSRSAAEIRAVVARQEAAGRVLVEPDLPIGKLPLPRTPVDRAVLATIACGATARTLVFVPQGRAPKGGLAKVKEERILDLWIARGRPAPVPVGTGPAASAGSALFTAAMTALERGPRRGKDLLREARELRRSGVSTADGKELAKELVRAWADERVRVHLVEPAG